jgi:hypothetical protein
LVLRPPIRDVREHRESGDGTIEMMNDPFHRIIVVGPDRLAVFVVRMRCLSFEQEIGPTSR